MKKELRGQKGNHKKEERWHSSSSLLSLVPTFNLLAPKPKVLAFPPLAEPRGVSLLIGASETPLNPAPYAHRHFLSVYRA